jgi:PIN domain nuclease of toxin-antitoxin system
LTRISRFGSYVIDAHTLLWHLEANRRLGPDAKRVLLDPDSALFVPAIALAEVCWFVEHGRSTIPSVKDLLADLDRDPRISLVPLDRAVLDIANTLANVGEMHDRQIVATALLLSRSDAPAAILTLDENIRRSGAAPIVW